MPDNESRQPRRALFARGSWAETSLASEILRKEPVGGALLLVATVIALANSPWSASYDALGDFTVGTASLGLHRDLSLATWASDGLLAIYFFSVGLELKREFVARRASGARRCTRVTRRTEASRRGALDRLQRAVDGYETAGR